MGIEKFINGDAQCRICNNKINYTATLSGLSSQEASVEASVDIMVVATMITTGVLRGSDGPLIQTEIIADCPTCGAKNKYQKVINKGNVQ